MTTTDNTVWSFAPMLPPSAHLLTLKLILVKKFIFSQCESSCFHILSANFKSQKSQKICPISFISLCIILLQVILYAISKGYISSQQAKMQKRHDGTSRN